MILLGAQPGRWRMWYSLLGKRAAPLPGNWSWLDEYGRLPLRGADIPPRPVWLFID